MTSTLSLRQLWLIYKRTALASTTSQREEVLLHGAFHSGALGVLKVLAHMIAQGDYEGLHATIERHGRKIKKVQTSRPPVRRH
jgi:hypothetical protein